MKMIKLNVGCGSNKWPDFINVDVEASLNPDVLCNIKTHKLPYETGTVDELYFIHTIEHIEEVYHRNILSEFHRVLKPEGKFVVAYPDFPKVASFYLENKRGHREFFKSVIYGRQLYPSDYHVAVIDTRYFTKLLAEIGFTEIQFTNEPEPNEFNTILQCQKGKPFPTKEDLLRAKIFNS